jgi:hypothetical protein
VPLGLGPDLHPRTEQTPERHKWGVTYVDQCLKICSSLQGMCACLHFVDYQLVISIFLDPHFEIMQNKKAFQSGRTERPFSS